MERIEMGKNVNRDLIKVVRELADTDPWVENNYGLFYCFWCGNLCTAETKRHFADCLFVKAKRYVGQEPKNMRQGGYKQGDWYQVDIPDRPGYMWTFRRGVSWDRKRVAVEILPNGLQQAEHTFWLERELLEAALEACRLEDDAD